MFLHQMLMHVFEDADLLHRDGGQTDRLADWLTEYLAHLPGWGSRQTE